MNGDCQAYAQHITTGWTQILESAKHLPMCPRLDWHMPRMCPMQVDMHCMKPQQDRKLPWQKVVTDDQGHETEFLLPSVAIATLVFHPCNWSTLHKRAEAVYKEGQRVYSHPLTCDQAIAAQAVVDGKPEVDGYRNLLVGCNFAKDKSETERTQSWTCTT